jgi:hypothetical protein
MKARSGAGAKGRSAGLVFAGALALVLTGVVLLVAINNRTAPGRDGDDLAVDISANPPNFGGDVVDIAAQTTGRFQAVDRSDPTRVSWELLFDRLDPLGGGMYRLSEPRAWFYFKDGQALHVRADAGTIKKPSATDSQIESGTFTGNVVASVFGVQDSDVRTGVSKARNADHDEPWLLAVMDRVSFDSVLLELSTQDPVRISTAAVQFDAKSLLARGNQVDNRLEYLSVTGPGLIRYAIGGGEDGEPAEVGEEPTAESEVALATDGGESVVADSAESKHSQAKPETALANGQLPSAIDFDRQNLYRAVFLDEVVVTQTGRRLSSDALEVWARVIDNKIPGTGRSQSGAEVTRSESMHGESIVRRQWDAQEAGVGGRTNERVAGVTHRVVPTSFVVERPRFGPRTLFQQSAGDVVLSWQGTLTAAPLEREPAELSKENHLHARFTAAKSGGVRFRDVATGGSGRSAAVDYAVTTRELGLRGSASAGRAWVHLPGTGVFVGDQVLARASTGLVTMRGAGVMAAERERPSVDDFGPLASFGRFDQARLSDLSRVEWRENAEMRFTVRDGVITEEIRSAEYVGGVAAHDGASTLKSEQLSVCFDRGLCDGEPNAGRVKTPTVRAFGAGSFEHLFEESRRRESDPERLVVTWKTSMFFEDPDDGPGHIRCDGDTVATATGPLALDVLKSHRLHLYFTDEPERSGGGTDGTRAERTGAADGMLAGGRRLERAEAVGASLEVEGGANASIESRRYAQRSEGEARSLTQIIYLEGPKIIAEQESGVLSVPQPGQAVVFDRRDEGGGDGRSSLADPLGGARGTSRFRWTGDFKLLRDSARIEIREDVEMVHHSIDDQPWVRLTSDRLTALLVTREMAAANASLREGRLASSLADGNVLIESQDQKRIVAERASYDVLANRVEASSEPPNVATFFDDQTAAPLRARRLRWDLGRDRVEIMEPAPITVPR